MAVENNLREVKLSEIQMLYLLFVMYGGMDQLRVVELKCYPFSQWELDDVEFDIEGNVMASPKKDIEIG